MFQDHREGHCDWSPQANGAIILDIGQCKALIKIWDFFPTSSWKPLKAFYAVALSDQYFENKTLVFGWRTDWIVELDQSGETIQTNITPDQAKDDGGCTN